MTKIKKISRYRIKEHKDKFYPQFRFIFFWENWYKKEKGDKVCFKTLEEAVAFLDHETGKNDKIHRYD